MPAPAPASWGGPRVSGWTLPPCSNPEWQLLCPYALYVWVSGLSDMLLPLFGEEYSWGQQCPGSP